MGECDTLQGRPNTRQDDPGSHLLLLQGPFNLCCWVYTAVPPAVAQIQQSKLWMRISCARELGVAHPTLLFRLPPSFTLNPAVPALTCSQHLGWSPYSDGCDGMRTETDAEVRVLLSSEHEKSREVHPSAVSLSWLLHWYIAIPLTPHCWMWELLGDISMMTRQCHSVSQFPEPSLEHLPWLHTCLQPPSFKPEWGWWPGCSSTRKVGGRDRFILLSSCPCSWSHSCFSLAKQLSLAEPVCMQGSTWSTPDADGKRGKERLKKPLHACSYMTLQWLLWVMFPGTKNIQQIRSVLAFRPLGNAIKNFSLWPSFYHRHI